MSQIARSRAFLVAPDSFKGTFGAAEVAAALGRGLERAGARAALCPLADGGEGTMDALGAEPVTATAHDPLGREVEAAWGRLTGDRAVVEVARASGLGRVSEEERDAEAASSYGTGELVAAAIATGAREVLVAAGGSATTDGGAGAVQAIRDAGGPGEASLVVLCDVRTPFEDAPRVFGPQKGADEAAVRRLEARLAQFAAKLPRDPRGVALTGAAGGLAGGLWAELGAKLVAGAPFVLDALGFDEHLAVAEAVVSGEGRLDAQSLEGKVVGEVAARCQRNGVPLHLVVGSAAPAFDERVLGLASVRGASTLEALEAAGRSLAGT